MCKGGALAVEEKSVVTQEFRDVAVGCRAAGVRKAGVYIIRR